VVLNQKFSAFNKDHQHIVSPKLKLLIHVLTKDTTLTTIVIEKTDMKKELKDNRIIYVGIGIFLLLTIGGFSSLFEHSIKDVLLNLNVQPIRIIWTEMFVQLITYAIGVILAINIIKSTKISELIIFRNVIILFILVQFLQYVQGVLNLEFKTEDYYLNSSDYYDVRQTDLNLDLITQVFSILNILIVGIIVYKKR